MKALICGVGGQDGAYLARLLLLRGYEVVGTSRDASATAFGNLQRLGIRERVATVSMATNDFRSVLSTVRRHRPDEIYNLAGQSSVALSFDQPVETIESIVAGTLNLLEAIRFEGGACRFYNAGSSECFGDLGDETATEMSPFRPRSPYAVAKASAHNLVACYREAYGLYACTGILFNHESPLRPSRFVTQKIVNAAAQIAAGRGAPLRLGNMEIHRDWGWAPDYVEAMHKMLTRAQPEDFIVATGRTVSLGYFVDRVFSWFGLDAKDHVSSDASLMRPSDVKFGRADPTKANESLGWRPTRDVDGVVDSMCEAAAEALRDHVREAG